MWDKLLVPATVIILFGGSLFSAYELGKSRQKAANAAEATLVAKQVAEATQRAAERLQYAIQTVGEADAVLSAIEEEFFHENAAPDLCAVDPGRVLRLDRIR